MLRRFAKYYKPHLKMFILDMTASFLMSLIGMLYPMMTRTMLNDYIPNQKMNLIVTTSLILFVLYFVRLLLAYFVQYYGHMIGTFMQAEMRKEMFEKLEKLPFSFFDNNETGQIMSRMTNDLFEIAELAHHGPENIFISGTMVLFSFIYLSTISFRLTLIIFSCVPVLAVISRVLRKRMKKSFRETRVALGDINASLESSISGIRVTKAFDNADQEMDKFEKNNRSFVSANKMRYQAMGLFHSSTTFVTNIFNVIVLLAGGYFLIEGSITFGDYSTFIISISLFIQPVTTLINFVEMYESGMTGFERFVAIIDEEEEVINPDAKDYDDLNGDIEFHDVSFSYNEKKEILDHVSFKVEKGKTLALVGPSGGGKTTICHLLPNFYHVESGKITIDGIDINDITYHSLRTSIGIVQQDVFLFNGTFKDNILYGKQDASDEEVIEAAKKANLYDYIMSLPDGFDTEIGERGVRLSGGQKQRLSIARVFLKNPSILILDEATSALDNTTEILIQNALDTLKEGRTTIVVAHRLSTIKNADEILVIGGGRVLEEGTHDELMDNNGIYAELYNLQFRTGEMIGGALNDLM